MIEILNQVKQWGNDDYYTDEQLKDAKEILRRDAIRAKRKTICHCQLCYLLLVQYFAWII